MTRSAAWIAVLLPALSRAQPPAIAQNGVVNAASQMPPALAASPIARGALFDIYGVRLAAAGTVAHVRVFREGSSVPVGIVTSDPRRLECVMPLDAPLGKVSLDVSVGEQRSLPFAIQVVRSNPAIFTRGGKGWGPAVAENLEASGRRVENSFDHPAVSGQSVEISMTGLGDGEKPRAWIGDKPAATAVRGRGKDGRQELIVRVPRDAAQGCFVPVTLETPTFCASNFATLAIRAGGGRCGMEQNGTAPLEGPRVGVLILGRTRTDDHGRETVWDELVASFAEVLPGPVMAPFAMPPPAGTCSFFAGSYQSGIAVPRSPSSALVDEIGGRGMNAGSRVVISGEGATRTITTPTGTPGVFIAKLGGDGGPPPSRPPFFQPGEYQITAPGGKELAPFHITLPSPPEFEWTNRDQVAVVDRTRPLMLTWRGVPEDRRVAIIVMNVDPASTALGTCFCVASAAAGRFTIPANVLANLPLGEDNPDPPLNVIELLSAPATSTMREFGPHFTAGVAFSVYGSAKQVSFR